MKESSLSQEVKAALNPQSASSPALASSPASVVSVDVPARLQQFYTIMKREMGILELSFNIGNIQSGLANKWLVSDQGFAMVKLPLLRILRRDSSFLGHDKTVWVVNRIQDPKPDWLTPLLTPENFVPTMIMVLNDEHSHNGMLTFAKHGEFTSHDKALALALRDTCAHFASSVLRQYTPLTQPAIISPFPSFEEQTGESLIGIQKGLQKVFSRIRFVASTNSPVLLSGETGTGKEVIARAIHNLSARQDKPFIAVNCGAIPEGLLDSELFGHERGAFTSAIARHMGYFEQANGGTILLDEIGELPPSAQTRLLRILQEKKLQRVGGSQTLAVDIRILAATHRDLKAMIQAGTFREDLYYRLRIVEIAIPPLRDRKEDIPELLDFFLKKHTAKMGFSSALTVNPQELPFLMQYSWPGNVRELENAVEHALVFSDNKKISFAEILPGFDYAPVPQSPSHASPATMPDMTLDHLVRTHIEFVLETTKGRIQGPKGAAILLGCNPNTLRKKMRKLSIDYQSVRRGCHAPHEDNEK